jgi:hypothetical protein
MVSQRGVLTVLAIGIGLSSLGLASCTQLTTQVKAQSPSTPVETQQPEPTPQLQEPKLDVPYVPTPQAVVDKMIEMGQVNGQDVLYDLGSGDGRIPITAARKFGTRGVGIDIDPARIKEANENARKAGVSDRVQFLQQDLFKTDLRKATVVMLYLLPDVNLRLRPTLLRDLKPGTRIVSHEFNMGDWKPEQMVEVQGPNREHTVYLWIVPEQVPENLR